MLLTIAIVACALSWGSFVFWYTVRARWWRTDLGRNTFGVSLFLALIVGRLALIRITGNDWDFTLSGVVLYWVGAALGIQRLVFMERAQREGNT